MKIPSLAIRTFFITIALNTMIAVALSVFDMEHSLFHNMVYSHCIGFLIWGMSYTPMHKFGWKVMPFSVLLGYLIGTAGADWLLEANALASLFRQPLQFSGLLLVSLGAGIGMSWYFISHNRLITAEHQAAESRLKLLESQLEPHMLFNTLANLHTLIAIDPEAAQNMLNHLTAYLRATLNASRATTHTLEQEFARLDDYLTLMKIRMGNRLQYALHLPDDLRHYSIPPLLLQPLVENAICHGLEPAINGGRVDVYARRENNQIILQVIDTGKGFDKPLKDIKENFGLTQVRERLQTLHGTASAMILEAPAAGGACVTVVFTTHAA